MNEFNDYGFNWESKTLKSLKPKSVRMKKMMNKLFSLNDNEESLKYVKSMFGSIPYLIENYDFDKDRFLSIIRGLIVNEHGGGTDLLSDGFYHGSNKVINTELDSFDLNVVGEYPITQLFHNYGTTIIRCRSSLNPDCMKQKGKGFISIVNTSNSALSDLFSVIALSESPRYVHNLINTKIYGSLFRINNAFINLVRVYDEELNLIINYDKTGKYLSKFDMDLDKYKILFNIGVIKNAVSKLPELL